MGEGYSPRSMTFLLADIPAYVFTKFKNILIFRRFHGLKGGLLKQTLQLLFLDNSANFYPCFCFHQKNPPAPLVDNCSVSKMNIQYMRVGASAQKNVNPIHVHMSVMLELWKDDRGQGENPWVCILASTKPYQAEICPPKHITQLGWSLWLEMLDIHVYFCFWKRTSRRKNFFLSFLFFCMLSTYFAHNSMIKDNFTFLS